jgi:hypothetical protein
MSLKRWVRAANGCVARPKPFSNKYALPDDGKLITGADLVRILDKYCLGMKEKQRSFDRRGNAQRPVLWVNAMGLKDDCAQRTDA